MDEQTIAREELAQARKDLADNDNPELECYYERMVRSAEWWLSVVGSRRTCWCPVAPGQTCNCNE